MTSLIAVCLAISSLTGQESAGIEDGVLKVKAMEMAGFVLAHAAWKCDGEAGNVLVPFSMFETKKSRITSVYALPRLEDGVKAGRAAMEKKRPLALSTALAYAGIERPSGADIIVVEVWYKAGTFEITQKYKLPTKSHPFSLVGDPQITVGHKPTSDKNLTAALFAGINQHEPARHYWRP